MKDCYREQFMLVLLDLLSFLKTKHLFKTIMEYQITKIKESGKITRV